MKRLFLCILFLFAFLFIAPSAKAGLQVQVSSNPFFVQQQIIAVPTNAFLLNGGCGVGSFGFNSLLVSRNVGSFGGGQNLQIQQGGRRGFGFRRGGQQIQQSGGFGGQNLQINQQRGFFGGIRNQQIQSSGPGGNFQLNQGR